MLPFPACKLLSFSLDVYGYELFDVEKLLQLIMGEIDFFQSHNSQDLLGDMVEYFVIHNEISTKTD